MSLLLATSWSGQGQSNSNANSVFYGAYSKNQCVSIPAGYMIQSMDDFNQGYIKLIGSSRFSRNLLTACVERYKVSKTNSSASCTSCLAGKHFHSGGEDFNTFSMPVSSQINQNIKYYGPYKQLWNTKPMATTTTQSSYEYLFDVDWSDSQGIQCVDICPIGFKAWSDPTAIKGTSICQKCSKDLGEYGKETGSCSICSETTYPKEDAALQCSECPWPFLSHIPPLSKLNEYHSCMGDLASIAFPIFCLCLGQNDTTVICILITVFFSINLFTFFYFGDFSKSIDNSLKQKPSDEVRIDTLDSNKKKKERKLNKRDVFIGLTAYIFVPFIDNITDLAFLLSNKFVSFIFFALFSFFFCLPGLYFFKTLLELKAVPKFYILPMPKFLLYDEYNTLYKVIVGTIVLFPFVVVNTPVLFPVSYHSSIEYILIYNLTTDISIIYRCF